MTLHPAGRSRRCKLHPLAGLPPIRCRLPATQFRATLVTYPDSDWIFRFKGTAFPRSCPRSWNELTIAAAMHGAAETVIFFGRPATRSACYQPADPLIVCGASAKPIWQTARTGPSSSPRLASTHVQTDLLSPSPSVKTLSTYYSMLCERRTNTFTVGGIWISFDIQSHVPWYTCMSH